MKKLLVGVAVAFAALALIVLTRALLLPRPAPYVEAPVERAAGDAAAPRLAEAIRIRTISGAEAPPDAASIAAFTAFLERAYPAAHRAMERENVGAHALLYRWRGASAEGAIALLAHMDVVPVDAATEGDWTHPPFDGVIADGFVWGRGSLDNKGQLIAIMEAAERLAVAGFRPGRDIYFLFGADEERGGDAGAAAIRRLLDARGVRFAFTLDEGSGLVDGAMLGAATPIALIATAEKGYATLRFTARAKGGHSSAPGEDTAVSIAARAAIAVTDAPFPLVVDRENEALLKAIAPYASFVERVVLANLWLFRPLVARSLGASPTTAAALHTTTAATIIDGGVKENVLPETASLIVNFRIHPRDTVASVKARAEAQVKGLPVDVTLMSGGEPSPRSAAAGPSYELIRASIAEIFGPVPVAPFLTLQGTDTRHFIGAADGNYRFTPFLYDAEDLARMHGTDERVSTDNLARAISWYEALLKRAAG
jgi:carboxypeptidase PM20D1